MASNRQHVRSAIEEGGAQLNSSVRGGYFYVCFVRKRRSLLVVAAAVDSMPAGRGAAPQHCVSEAMENTNRRECDGWRCHCYVAARGTFVFDVIERLVCVIQ